MCIGKPYMGNGPGFAPYQLHTNSVPSPSTRIGENTERVWMKALVKIRRVGITNDRILSIYTVIASKTKLLCLYR